MSEYTNSGTEQEQGRQRRILILVLLLLALVVLGRRRGRRLFVLGSLLLVAGGILYLRYNPNRPVTYDDIEEHFKYGSIGSDLENGLPLRVLQVLPRMFPEYLPKEGPRDYTAFGFIQEPGKALPIGFSTRRHYIDLVGLNCAACHVGVVRETPLSQPVIYLGMPSNTVDLESFFFFLFRCAGDNRFNPDAILAEMDKDGRLLAPDRLIYKLAIIQMKAGLLQKKAQLERFITPDHPAFGPGRVDTFNPYKANQFSEAYHEDLLPAAERYGTVDLPSIWNQQIREGMNLHWDGNNNSVMERNYSAAFGAGATCENVDTASMARIKAWIDTLPAPKYPFPIDQSKVARGKSVYDQYCANCHEPGGQHTGQVTPIQDIATDRHRLDSYTEKLHDLQIGYCKGKPYEFQHFTKTDGYANAPLDGIWARAPYLHNGSVPTLWDLLTPDDKRNNGKTSFYAGHSVYDPNNVGFRTDVASAGGRPSFLFDISLPGNSNKGHTGEPYGTELSDADKRALIEYLKTK